jgi:hypothetical protein
MHVLPDGSAFFTMTIGKRHEYEGSKFVNWLKYRPQGCARRWLFVWRMFWSAHALSRWPDQGSPMSYWRAQRYALSCP